MLLPIGHQFCLTMSSCQWTKTTMGKYQRQVRDNHAHCAWLCPLCFKFISLLYTIINIHHQGELKLARKNLTMKQIESIIKKLDNNGDGTISLEEMKKGKWRWCWLVSFVNNIDLSINEPLEVCFILHIKYKSCCRRKSGSKWLTQTARKRGRWREERRSCCW